MKAVSTTLIKTGQGELVPTDIFMLTVINIAISGLNRRNPTLVPVVRELKPRCGRPHIAPTHNGVRVSLAGTAQRPESVSGRKGPWPLAYRAR